jgi:excisionase family DNA binding protein
MWAAGGHLSAVDTWGSAAHPGAPRSRRAQRDRSRSSRAVAGARGVGAILLRVAVLLTVEDVARELQASPKWVRARIAAHELRAVQRVGRGFRIRREWLDAFLATLEIAAPAESPGRHPSRGGATASTVRKPFGSVREARAELVLLRGRS